MGLAELRLCALDAATNGALDDIRAGLAEAGEELFVSRRYL